MRREAIAHRRRSRRERHQQQSDLAPPPYASADAGKVGGDSELPGYSAVDPYASSTNPQVIPGDSDTPTTLGNNDEDAERVINDHQEEEGRGEVVTMELENRPLLSEDSAQS